MKTFPLALQTYTVRDDLARDFFGTLARIREIGYTAIETGALLPGVPLSDALAHLQRLGLRVVGIHAPLESLAAGLDAQLDFVLALGGAYLGVSRRYESRAEVLAWADRYNHAGEACRARGVQFVYHNHNWEFTRFDGDYAYDLLIEHTDPALVRFQLDTYWVQRGGEDPAAYLRRLAGRCPLLHIKDLEPGPEQFYAEIGEGVLDWPAIFGAAAAAGVQWLIVEQDQCRRPPFESAALSYRNLMKMGLIEGGTA
jgi:sugar phosphate isomerase/epimerase